MGMHHDQNLFREKYRVFSLNFSNEPDLSTKWLSRDCRAQQWAQHCCRDKGQCGAELSPAVISPKTKHDEQFVSPKVLFKKLAGVRDRPSPALGVKWVQFCVNSLAAQGLSPARASCPPQGSFCICNQSSQEDPWPREELDHVLYQNTPTKSKHVGKETKI